MFICRRSLYFVVSPVLYVCLIVYLCIGMFHYLLITQLLWTDCPCHSYAKYILLLDIGHAIFLSLLPRGCNCAFVQKQFTTSPHLINKWKKASGCFQRVRTGQLCSSPGPFFLPPLSHSFRTAQAELSYCMSMKS